MFKIVQEPTFTHTVKARVPIDGGFREESFKATYRVIDPVELEKLDLSTNEGSTEFLHRTVARLDDIGDAEGNAVEWSDEVFAMVLRLPWARAALARGYFSAIAGAKAGN